MIRKRLKAAWRAFLHPEFFELEDPLTGALSFKEFKRRAERLIGRVQDISLIFIDIDNLKEVNDSWGYSSGNLHLKNLAEIIFSNIRKTDLLCRLHGEGGDEFIVFLPGVNQSKAEEIVRRIQRSFPTFSWGIAEVGGENDTLDSLLAIAEKSMFLQKKLKKNISRI